MGCALSNVFIACILSAMANTRRIPLLLVGDAVSAGTGLGRIIGDLALRIHDHLGNVYRVATAGYASPGSIKYPFQQYVFDMKEWVISTLPQIWLDFAGDEKGVVLFVWDASRLGWFSQPEQSQLLADDPALRGFLMNPPFERWIYCPVDSEGPGQRLTFPVMKSLLGFDRIIAYGAFGLNVIHRTISHEESVKRHLAWLPHGIETDIFYPADVALCRKMFIRYTGAMPLFGTQPPIASDEILIGIVATNQARKDWALGVEVCAELAKRRKIRLWIHTDVYERYWSIPCLLIDFGLVDKTITSLGFLSDERMAQAYSACDVTLGIGPEGFGYPIAESLACGTPVVVGSYGGQSDFVPPEMQVQPIAFRYDGSFTCRRPVFSPTDWADTVERVVGMDSHLAQRYDWHFLWEDSWEPYFRAAVNRP